MMVTFPRIDVLQIYRPVSNINDLEKDAEREDGGHKKE